jgi:hypothetical protein
MESKWGKTLIVFVITLLPLISNAKRFVVLNNEKAPIAQVTATCYNASMDSIASSISDDNGIVNISTDNTAFLMLSHKDFSSKLLSLQTLSCDTILMNKVTNLDEVVVSPQDKQHFLTHDSYKLAASDMARYTNFYQALNEIPNLVVTSSGALYFEGNSNVILLLDGVNTSAKELASIAKDDISKVNIYQTPPPRFAMQGVSAVIDVITKSGLTGGNGALNMSQAFYPLVGENSAAIYYNYKRSRFSILYNNSNRHFNKYRLDEKLSYQFDDVEYTKTKTGLDSDSDTDDNALTLTFQNNLKNSYLYNLQVEGAINREYATYKQLIAQNDVNYFANKLLNSKYNRYQISNYFEKHLGENSNYGTLMGNVMYRRYNTRYLSGYAESLTDNSSTPFADEHSEYHSLYDAIMGEIQYEFPDKGWGYMVISVADSYKYSKYQDLEYPFSLRNNQFQAAAMYMGQYKRISYIASLGVGNFYSASPSQNISSGFWIPSPMIKTIYSPKRNLRFTLEYSYRGNVPTISQLSETEQWLDTKLVYHGNSTLKPYKTHNLRLISNVGSKYISSSLNIGFEYSPDMLCDHFIKTDNYMLQTIINLDKYFVLSGQLTLSVTPLGNNKFIIWNRVIGAKVHGKGVSYDWNGYRFQWMFMGHLNLNKWSAEIYYQYPGKVAEGQLIRPRAQVWSLTGYYRPIQDLSIGLELWMPFGKHFKDSERTVSSALVYMDNENLIKDWTNMISLKLSWNFSFGKRHNYSGPQFSNGDNDTGILKK